jgi:hypothetical protein
VGECDAGGIKLKATKHRHNSKTKKKFSLPEAGRLVADNLSLHLAKYK